MSAPAQFPDIPGLTPVRHLGSGGYADVFLYEQHTPRRRVAVKVLRDHSLSAKHVDRFMSEANAMAELAHPHIVPVFSTGVAPDGRPYIVMMYYPPPSLGDRAARFEVSEVLRIGIQVGSAVETAHRAGILHRDIKPANILVSQYGQPGLTDFGIAAQIAEADDEDDQGLSLPWSPPEVVFATAPARPCSDTYSLAATLWNLLVGRSPFETPGAPSSSWELMARIRDLPAPSTGLPVPSSLDRLLRQTMAKDPDGRPRRAMDFVMALQAIEQELHLARTEAVVEDQRVVSPLPPPAAARSNVGATRIKGPTEVPATRREPPPAAPTPAPAPPPGALVAPPAQGGSAASATVYRPAAVRPAPAAESPGVGAATQRRVSAAQPQPEPIPQPAPGTRRRYAAVALGGALVIIALVAAIILTRAGRSDTGTAAPTRTTQAGNIGALGDALPPGPVTVKGTRKDAVATFTWTYSAQLPSDTYQWRTPDASASGVAKTPTQDLPAPVGATVCLQVKVVRADGSNASTDWSKAGCVT